MELFFIEAPTEFCCLYGPYKTKGDAERRLARLTKESEIKYLLIQKIAKEMTFARSRMTIWIVDGMWIYENDLITVNEDGYANYQSTVEKLFI